MGLEDGRIKAPVILEGWGARRYEMVAETARSMLDGSGIIDPAKPITEQDPPLLVQVRTVISPNRYKTPWAEMDGTPSKGGIVDPSTFGNWELPGGPKEHIDLTMQAADPVTETIRFHLLDTHEVSDEWAKRAIEQLQAVDKNHLAVVMGFHDFGREALTHIFGTTELVGGSLLNKIGVVEHIKDKLPSERLMLTSPNEDMFEVFKGMHAEAVVARYIDEFAKRKPGMNRLMQPDDFDPAAQEAWAARYLSKPSSGVPSDSWMRRRFPLHNQNAPRYFDAMDRWFVALTGQGIRYHAQELNQRLAPTLVSLPTSSE